MVSLLQEDFSPKEEENIPSTALLTPILKKMKSLQVPQEHRSKVLFIACNWTFKIYIHETEFFVHQNRRDSEITEKKPCFMTYIYRNEESPNEILENISTSET